MEMNCVVQAEDGNRKVEGESHVQLSEIRWKYPVRGVIG